MKARWHSCAVFVLVISVGAFLRCHGVTRQVLMADEWHALRRAARFSVGHLFITYFPRATAIPLNVYNRLLLMTFGWSELGIRLPSILSALATLLAVPWVVWKTFRSTRMALTAAVLFALSPFWIYYGQNARPYSSFFLGLWLANYFFWRTLHGGRRGDALRFAFAGAVAAYFHLYALIAVGSLGLVALVRVILAHRARAEQPAAWRVALARYALGFGVFGVLLALFYGPSLVHRSVDELPRTENLRGGLDGTSLSRTVELLSGCTVTPLALALVAGGIAGVVLASRRRPWFVATLLVPMVASALVTAVARPHRYTEALVLLRYNVSIFMLYFVGMSALVDAALRRLERSVRGRLGGLGSRGFARAALVAFSLATLFLSPTPRNLALLPHNFAMHSAFAEYYSRWNPTGVRPSAYVGAVDRRDIHHLSEFYGQLAREPHPCVVLDYPVLMEDYLDPQYLYQKRHGCEVIMGFSRDDHLGQFFDTEDVHQRLHFARALWIDDERRVRDSDARYLVVHLDKRKEAMGEKHLDISPETRRVLQQSTKRYGKPVFDDRYLRVFRIPPGSRQ